MKCAAEAKVSPGFQKSADKLDALEVITSTKANSLRKRAYQEVHADGSDPCNAAAYGDVFERLSGHRTDKPTTRRYLENAATEFKNHKRVVDARPVVQAALERAARNSEEWKGVVDFARGIKTMSSFGSPNTPVGFIVAFHLKDTSRAPEYYAEKVAELLANDATLAPYRDLMNTLVIYGYGSYKLPADPGKNALRPAPIAGSLAVEGAPPVMAKALADVERRGRVLMSEADKLFYPLYFKHFETFPNTDVLDAYKAGLEKLLPHADHKMVKRVLESALGEVEGIRTSILATKAVTELFADPKKLGSLAKLVDTKKSPEPQSGGVMVWAKAGVGWQQTGEIGRQLLELAKAVPGFPAGDLRINVYENRR